MSGDGTFVQATNWACGGLLLTAVVILWRRQLAAIVALLAVQGVLLATLALLLAVRSGDAELYAVAAGILVLKGVVLPTVLARVLGRTGSARDAEPLVNVPASLVAAALLTLLSYAVCRPLVALQPSPATRALPAGFALVLIGFFVLVTRRQALSQVAGFLLLDNGIAAVALLATAGVPLIVELGAALDLLFVVLVLQVLAGRMQLQFGGTDLDDLRELRD
jgi:hydrogenase-4 component E